MSCFSKFFLNIIVEHKMESLMDSVEGYYRNIVISMLRKSWKGKLCVCCGICRVTSLKWIRPSMCTSPTKLFISQPYQWWTRRCIWCMKNPHYKNSDILNLKIIEIFYWAIISVITFFLKIFFCFFLLLYLSFYRSVNNLTAQI